MHCAGHVEIQRGHQMIGIFNHRHFHTKLREIFRHFNADKTASDHSRTLRPLFPDKAMYFQSILHRAKGENFAVIYSAHIQARRFCAGRKKQFVIAVFQGLSCH